jgi:hypothetical protein
MSTTPTDKSDHPDGEADRNADMMRDQLRKDVESWSAARSGAPARQAAEVSVPGARQPSLQPAKRARPPRPVSPDVAKTESGPKKPFSMSYDGVTDADYITYMISRGTR